MALPELFAKADVISLHCPLTEETHHMIDDAAVELVKNAIVTVVRKNLDGNVHAYFCAATEEELRFALFVKGRQEPVYQTTKMAVYRQSQEVLRTLDYKSPDDFAVVNSKLAQSLLDEYKSI